MIWRCLGRLSALVVCGVVAGPVWAEPYLRVAQSAESPAAPAEPPAQSTPDTPTGDAPPQTGAWEFALNGRNIFDETYVSWCGDYVADDPTLFTRCRYGDARTVVARANYRW